MSNQESKGQNNRESELEAILRELYDEDGRLEHDRRGDTVRFRFDRGAFAGSYSSTRALAVSVIKQIELRLGQPSAVITDDERRGFIARLRAWLDTEAGHVS
jgi:hypothetical protein